MATHVAHEIDNAARLIPTDRQRTSHRWSNITRSTTAAPTIFATIDEDGGQRISVLGTDRAEICGAFKPVDRPYWLMYVTKTIADVIDRSRPTLIPHRLQLPAQQDARQWLELIAGLYMKAVNQ